ncbi:mitochondrial inner membrane protein OXA1L isoform X2 [Dendroctonus ponderosae]
MSGYHRISTLKNCLNSLKGVKHINKLNDVLSKKIDAACSKRNSSGNLTKFKELNQVLTKEFNTAAEKLKSNPLLAVSKEAAQNCKDKLEQTCKPLYLLPDMIEEKKEVYKKKYLKSKHIKKEAQKLCQFLSKRSAYRAAALWTAPAISLMEDKPATVAQASPDAIPEPPLIPDPTAEALSNLNSLGEATFESLGLGGWTPVGIVQQCMEFLHVSFGIDWWLAIVIGTFVIRICMFPLVILAQRNAAKMNNCMPQMQLLQMKMTEARQTGDAMSAARYSQELMLFLKERGVNPLKNMLVPLAQAPIFISFFMGLREMANVPVDSLTHGGMLWFTDLTLPDQYFLMPCITSLTLWLTIEVGADTAKLASQNGVLIKYGLRALPLVILPFTVNFPGAILCYWVSTNFISLLQAAFLRIPKVRDHFKIERLMSFTPDQLPVKPKGFTEGVKDSWTNIKITRELEERRKLDELQFQRAGKGPVTKTYKYDPTKQTSPINPSAISAKKR